MYFMATQVHTVLYALTVAVRHGSFTILSKKPQKHGIGEYKAIETIEFFSNRLWDACGVCPADKRNPFDCEIAGTDNERLL